jgi:hypothetical protein
MVIIISTAIHSFRERLDLPVAPQRKGKSSKRKAKKSHQFNFFRRAKAKTTRGQGRKQREGLVDATIDHGDQDGRNDQEIRGDHSRKESERGLDRPRRPVRVPHQSELPEWEPPQDDSGLIMLEID